MLLPGSPVSRGALWHIISQRHRDTESPVVGDTSEAPRVWWGDSIQQPLDGAQQGRGAADLTLALATVWDIHLVTGRSAELTENSAFPRKMCWYNTSRSQDEHYLLLCFIGGRLWFSSSSQSNFCYYCVITSEIFLLNIICYKGYGCQL